MKSLLLCLSLCFLLTSASVSMSNEATISKAPLIKVSPTMITKTSFHADTIANSSSMLDLKVISNPAYNISGKWDMVGNSVFRFELDLKQTNNIIHGTMTRTNGNEPIDSIEGTVNQGGMVEFNRVRPNQWSQKYNGSVSQSSRGSYIMKGTFTQTSVQGEFSWNATLIQPQTKISVGPTQLSAFAPKVPSIGSQGETAKVESPIEGKYIQPKLNNPILNKEWGASVPNQKQNPKIRTVVHSVSLSHFDWRNLQRAAMSKLGVYTSANLDYADSSSSFIDSSGNELTARFRWSPTTTKQPASAVWQVSMMAFPYDPVHWANPPGLLAQGTLKSDQNEFTLDFSKFIPTPKEVANRWSISRSYLTFQKSILASFKNVAAANLAQVDPSNIPAVQANKDFMLWADEAIKQIDARPAMISASHQVAIKKSSSGLTPGRKILNPILTTKSISSPVKISQQRTANATSMKNVAEIIGSQGSITNNRQAIRQVSQSALSLLSKETLLNALPQDQRTYYVRVVPLDANNNCTGLPSDQKEVIVGKPIVEPGKWTIMQSAILGPRVKLAIAGSAYRPHYTSGEFPCNGNWYLESDAYVDWSQDLNRWCLWSSSLTNLTAAEWQISEAPFDNEELMNPAGLVARGKLNVDLSDLKSTECAGEMADISSNANASGHEFSIDFSKFAPSRDPNKPQQITYYLRVVALVPNGPGMFIGYPSGTRTINYGHQTQPKAALPVSVTVFLPDITILSYKPIQNADPEADYRFIATVDNPPQDIKIGSEILFPKGSLWHKGEQVNTKPKDQSWWDEVVDFFESIGDFFASIVNWVSSAWDTIKGACANLISKAICFDNADCSDAVGPWVSGGIDACLAAMGIPPSIPNFDQLTSMGSDYMAKTLLETAGVDPDMVDFVNRIEPDTIKQGVNAFIDESGSGGPYGLKPDPAYQYHPAYMIVEVKNNQNEPTLPGTFMISEPNHVFVHKPVAIPSLQPAESLRIPLIFNPVNCTDYMVGNTWYSSCEYDWSTGKLIRGPNWEICSDEWEKFYGEPETFSVSLISCNISMIDTAAIKEKFEETGDTEGSPVYIKYIYTGGKADAVQITPNQPWSFISPPKN